MDYVASWIEFFIALFQTSIQWLGSIQILGVPVMWIVIASFFLAVLVRSLLIKP